MHKIYLLLLVTILTTTAQAQKGNFGLGLNVGAANPFLNKNLNTGLSGTVSLYYHTSATGSVSLNYTTFNNQLKKYTPKTSLNTQLITLGYRQYLSAKKTWFVEGDVGATVYPAVQPIVGLGGGYSIQMKRGSIDLGVKYFVTTGPNNNMFLMPYIGLKFRLGKK